jgi:glycosyltransferase involved in cell wall biosynthesis
LRVIDRLNVGGPALQATVLSDGLAPDRFEQLLLTGDVDAHEGDYVQLRAPNLPVEHVAGLGRAPQLSHDVRALATVRRAIRRFQPDIVHTHKAKAGVLGRTAAWSTGVPVTIHSFHGHLLRGYFSPRKTQAVVAVERALAWRTTRLVAVGAQVRDELLAAGVGRPDRYVVVPPGVELPPPPSLLDARRSLGLPPSSPVIAFVARLTAVKRPDRFIEVARVVIRRHPDAVFVIAGEGELMAAMQAQASPLGDHVRFLGWRGDVESIYAAADVVVLTSDNEGMPVSLIEAALCGRPAVTTDVGSAPEVVIDGVTGFVTTASVVNLAEAVDKLLRDEATRVAMGAEAGRRAQITFGAARLVSDMTALYESVAGDAR